MWFLQPMHSEFNSEKIPYWCRNQYVKSPEKVLMLYRLRLYILWAQTVATAWAQTVTTAWAQTIAQTVQPQTVTD